AVRFPDTFVIARELRNFGRGFRDSAATAARSAEQRWEFALRFALAAMPCAVLALYLPGVLGTGRASWAVPLAMGFVNAWMAISLARELLRGRRFLVFWAVYGLVWTAVAWHGLHFHRPPRPAAVLMNLEEIVQTPLPAGSEIPWIAPAGGLGLGWLARKPSPCRAPQRFAAGAAILIFVVFHAVTL